MKDVNVNIVGAALYKCEKRNELLEPVLEAAKGVTASVLANYHDEVVDGKLTITLDADDMDDLIAAVANAQ